MSNSKDNEDVSFRPSFLISWCLCGIVYSVILFLAGLSAGEINMAIAGVFFGPVIAIVFGGLLFVLDAAARHRFNFMRVKNHIWVWRLYPLISPFIIVFSLMGGIIGAMMKNL